MCVDIAHRHIIFTIPENYRVLFRKDRIALDLLFIICNEYNPLDRCQMVDNIEKSVLMKCENCEELVPLSDLEILRSLSTPDDIEDHLLCPFCIHDMYRKDSFHFK